MTMQQAHDKLGHCNKDMTHKAAKTLGIELSRGSLGPCAAYISGKAKQKAVPKCSKHVPSAENIGRMFLDIVTIKQIYSIMVEERTNFSIFYETKDRMVATKQNAEWLSLHVSSCITGN
jgi:hypothetical protein